MDKLIATIPKKQAEEINIGLGKSKGHNLVSLQVWIDAYAGEERVPTIKGITVRVQLLPDLIAALQKAEGEVRAAGMLRDDTTEKAA